MTVDTARLQSFPTGTRSRDGTHARMPSTARDEPPCSGPLVLVADDALDNQMVAVRMLENSGYRVEVAENGRVALEAMSRRPYAAVLLDCHMPELDGYEVTREIRRREHGGARTPIIAMTANSMQDARERCLAAGMDDYLAKPLRIQPLTDVLRRWTAGPASADPTPGPDSGDLPPSGAGGGGLLDESVIAELASLDDGLLASLLPPYFEEAAGQLSDLGRAIAHGDAPAVAQIAHKLKGSSASLGAAGVSHLASELEATDNRGGMSPAVDLLDRLRIALARTREAFGAGTGERP